MVGVLEMFIIEGMNEYKKVYHIKNVSRNHFSYSPAVMIIANTIVGETTFCGLFQPTANLPGGNPGSYPWRCQGNSKSLDGPPENSPFNDLLLNVWNSAWVLVNSDKRSWNWPAYWPVWLVPRNTDNPLETDGLSDGCSWRWCWSSFCPDGCQPSRRCPVGNKIHEGLY